MKSPRSFLIIGALSMLSLAACTPGTNGGPNLMTAVGCDMEDGAKIACQVAATGEPVVQEIDASIVKRNATNIGRAEAACALVGAVPVPSVCSPAPSPAAPAAAPGS